jgi:hypothetical protein
MFTAGRHRVKIEAFSSEAFGKKGDTRFTALTDKD